ncbi:MAG: endonuclease/exonuclease/phosphatase family protein [Krumholzibacteria bacterium]|nr:endonuclease/exonuclease/phosphatase family protein [Candidatus Krumholzibacteria bacterium]
MRARRRHALLLPGALALLAAGCGTTTGYAPETAPVYHGRPSRPAPAAVADSLTIVAWNIQYGEDVPGALAELRAHPRLAVADVILLQEMGRDGVAALAESLGLHWVYGLASIHPHHAKPFGNAVLARWPLTAPEPLTLPHPTPVTGHRRIAVAADVELGEGTVLRAVSVHTATMLVDQDKRIEQAAAVLDSLGGSGPVIVGGDFNTVSDWEVTLLRRVARRAGFRHLWLPPGPTIANRYLKLPGQAAVLDHVLVRDLEAGARGVVRTATASDHYPVWAVVARPGAPVGR